MKRVFIDLPLADDRDRNYARVVRAEIIPEIAPHLAAVLTPAVHRNVRWGPEKWRVSDMESGHRIGDGGETRLEAVNSAQCLLSTKTVENVRFAHAMWAKEKDGATYYAEKEFRRRQDVLP